MIDPTPFWSQPADQVLAQLHTSAAGLTADDVQSRKKSLPRRAASSPFRRDVGILFSQVRSPTTLILIGAAALSSFLHEATSTLLILSIVLISVLLGFWQERTASRTLAALQQLVTVRVTVRRIGCEQSVSLEEVLPGDIVCLSAGATVPGDGLLLEAKDLHIDESTLTGESFPAEKMLGIVPQGCTLAMRTNVVFQGTHVVSGTALAVMVHVGQQTEFGQIADKLRLRPPETDFERGIRRFGYFLMQVTFLMILGLFGVNVYMHRPVLESLLFALALAVGLTPQLLPAIITVNLAHGATLMARHRVILRRLSSIENFGCMDVLCSDKTGTLTQGKVELHAAVDPEGVSSDKVARLAFLNAQFESGFNNAIDEALRSMSAFDACQVLKLDEVPYDFIRKRVSILIDDAGRHILIMKGAVDGVLETCTTVEYADGRVHDLNEVQTDLQQEFQKFGRQGLRVLGLACRDLGARPQAGKSDETEMVFVGFLAFRDPPKDDAARTLLRLREVGVSLKMITGDNRWVAAQVARDVGLSSGELLCGADLKAMNDGALTQRAGRVDVFAEVEPNQKERIILALKKAGHVVGYLGDGINDASALHAADVGISVDQAADVAKEAADIVLLEHDLGVLVGGILAGRQTFANTLKYIFMATSANFGNMFSMAGASLFLPFLPLLPEQILLANLMTDIPAMAIPTDRVDRDWLRKPQRWNMHVIRNFMLVFGLLSSLFDYLTFAVLLFVFQADVRMFRTGWFVESVISAALVVLVIRTHRPFLRSRPSRSLVTLTLSVILLTGALPWLPTSGVLGFEPVPFGLVAFVAGVVALYVISAEFLKRIVLGVHR